MTVLHALAIGLPPTIGLIGKIYLFRAVSMRGFLWSGYHRRTDLPHLRILLPARVVVTMYMQKATRKFRETFLV